MENTNYTFVRKAKIVGSDARKASPKSLQYPHGASRIRVRLKMMLECKVCFTLGFGQGKPCTPGVISSIAEFSASLLGCDPKLDRVNLKRYPAWGGSR